MSRRRTHVKHALASRFTRKLKQAMTQAAGPAVVAGGPRLGDGRHLDGDVHDLQTPGGHAGPRHWHVVVQALVVVHEPGARVTIVGKHHVHELRVARHLPAQVVGVRIRVQDQV